MIKSYFYEMLEVKPLAFKEDNSHVVECVSTFNHNQPYAKNVI